MIGKRPSVFVNVAHHFQRPSGQRTSAESAVADGCDRGRIGFESVAAGCRVCRDNAVESRFDQHVDHVVDLRVGQVGRYFQQDRPVLVLSAPEVDQTAQDQVQVVLVLPRLVRFATFGQLTLMMK